MTSARGRFVAAAGMPLGRSWLGQMFSTRCVEAKSLAGCRYTRKVWIGMPRVPDELLQATVYLYKTVEDAKAGRDIGGTGFLISVHSKFDQNMIITYVVTNWHVAVNDGNSCVRVNKKGGGSDVFELEPHEWEFRPIWHDIAIAALQLDAQVHNTVSLAEGILATDAFVSDHAIGPGDDVFMVGRFVDHDGGETNIPAVRFGNLSMMPYGEIKQPSGARLGSYLIDMHSRSGFSGSPVFAFRTFGNDFRIKSRGALDTKPFITLLGIHWGQFYEFWELADKPSSPSVKSGLGADSDIKNKRVLGLSGMGCVIPASAILELLYCKKFVEARDQAEAALLKERERDGNLPPAPEKT